MASNFETVFPDFTEATPTDLIKLSDDTHVVGEYSGDTPKHTLPDGASMVAENIKSIDESALIPYLVAAIKELEARIATLEGG